MASPILHIKDGYFFEVPKFLRPHPYESMEDVPEFLREAHSDATLEDFNREMSGKVLIPQPFGARKNLYEMKSGFGISKFMILELVVGLLLVWVFTSIARKVKNGEPVKGRFWNLFEVILIYIRDHVARPAIGKKDADRFLPVLWSIFFFILFCNLFGLVPWTGTATGAFGTTLALAFVIFCTSIGSGIKQFGLIGFFKNQVPSMDLPVLLTPLKLLIFAIEILGLFIKHAVLAIRLLANMVAGHLVLLAILGLITGAATASTGQWSMVMVVGVVGATLFSCLELFVAFLQAYVFTFLSALFIGASIHHH